MLLSTLSIDDIKNKEILGVVIGTSIRGSNLFRDMAARIADVMGGTARGYEANFSDTVAAAVDEMTRAAQKRGAIAVEGLRIVQSPLPMEKGGLFTVLAYGTAVKGERE